MTKEIWKSINWIKGYEDCYQVSNLGRVRSLDRSFYLYNNFAKREIKRFQKGRILKKVLDSDGYHILCFRNAPLKMNPKAHRLVAEAFIPNPENKPQVNHKNGIKTDNIVDNLEWCTAKENVVHSWKSGLCVVSEKQKRIAREMNSKLVLDTQTGIYYSSATEASKALNLNRSTLLSRLNGNLKNKTSLIYV